MRREGRGEGNRKKDKGDRKEDEKEKMTKKEGEAREM